MADDDQSSIPSLVDGLTPVQRTSLLCILKDQFAKDFSDHVSVYRLVMQSFGKQSHEKQNLVTSKTGMAHDDCHGSKSCQYHPLLHSSITRYLFRRSDEPLLEYLTIQEYLSEEDIVSEPTWLMPVIPIVLVNGGIGIKYNLRDVIANIRRLLKNEEFVPMVPCCIPKKTETSLPDRLLINEEEILKDKEQVVMPPDDQTKKQEGFHNKFESTTDLDTSNILLLDTEGRKMKYGTQEIIKDFFALRIGSYKERKSAMLKVIGKAVRQLENEPFFEYELWGGTVIIDYDKKDEVLYAEAKNHLLRSVGQLWDMDFGNNIQSECYAKMKEFDALNSILAEELWLNDLEALEEQLNEQYEKEAKGRKKWIPPVSDSESEKQEPSEVRSSSLEEDVSLVQDKDEPKMRKKRIPEQDKEDEAETRKRIRARV